MFIKTRLRYQSTDAKVRRGDAFDSRSEKAKADYPESNGGGISQNKRRMCKYYSQK